MNEYRNHFRLTILLSAVLCMLLPMAFGQQTGNAAKKQEFTFKGKVEKVDAATKTITVNNEKIEGWMDSMSMSYSVDKPDMLKKIKVGDQITAKVYKDEYKILHDVQVVVPTTGAKATSPKK
jgi:Cu/Ag efflux protein CusF